MSHAVGPTLALTQTALALREFLEQLFFFFSGPEYFSRPPEYVTVVTALYVTLLATCTMHVQHWHQQLRGTYHIHVLPNISDNA